MQDSIVLCVREANLLRRRLRHLLQLREELIARANEETVHDIRVASRRAREVLDYLETVIPESSFKKMQRCAKNLTSNLGEMREIEVNMKLSEKLQKKELIPTVAAELLMHSLMKRKEKLQQRVQKHMKLRNFASYQKFLSRLKGSRTMHPTVQEVLKRRGDDFCDFDLTDGMNDERLHELRILTKKFRYAAEIYNTLQPQKLGRFILRLKRLQEILGEIHDLFVFSNLLEDEKQKWNRPGLKMIPEALDHAIQVVSLQKEKLYPRARILYQRILDSTPEAIRPVSGEKAQIAQTSEARNPGTEEPESGVDFVTVSESNLESPSTE